MLDGIERELGMRGKVLGADSIGRYRYMKMLGLGFLGAYISAGQETAVQGLRSASGWALQNDRWKVPAG